MKAAPIIIALALLVSVPLQVQAQTAPTEPAPAPAPAPEQPVPTDEVGNTGTGTGTDSVGNTGTGTGTESIGNTGTGTGTATIVMSSAPLKITLSAQNSWMASNNSQPITVSVVVGADDVAETSGAETIPLSSSHSACKVPASVDLSWNSRTGGKTSFQVTCSKISGKSQTVTITGGNSSTSFTLKP